MGSSRAVKMKASLVLLCGLASVSLGKNLETLDVSVTESEAGGRSGGASTRFFWRQLYQGNCVAGCSVNSCDATCTVSSWLFTCEYQCGHVTDTCSQTSTSQSQGQTTSLGAAGTTGGATAADTTTAGAVTTTTSTTSCGLEDGATCTDPTGAECCSGVCSASVDGDNRCGGCLAMGDACTTATDCCSNVCDTTLGMCTV